MNSFQYFRAIIKRVNDEWITHHFCEERAGQNLLWKFTSSHRRVALGKKWTTSRLHRVYWTSAVGGEHSCGSLTCDGNVSANWIRAPVPRLSGSSGRAERVRPSVSTVKHKLQYQVPPLSHHFHLQCVYCPFQETRVRCRCHACLQHASQEEARAFAFQLACSVHQ